MTRILLTFATLAVVGPLLAGCGGGKGGGVVVAPPPAAAPFEDQFGSATGFGTAFRQPNTTADPRDINAGDVISVNPTADPVMLPGT